MSENAVTGVIILLAALLSAVIIVGLLTQSLDTTSVALTLCTGMTGIVGGAIMRGRAKSNQDKDEGGDDK